MENYSRKIDRNCGICGQTKCSIFDEKLEKGLVKAEECPYIKKAGEATEKINKTTNEEDVEEVDSVGRRFDFKLKAIGDEPSARKIIRPFRVDLIEKLNIQPGDYITGRPVGAGCPITHVLKVFQVEELTGILYTWAVGPKVARENECKDIGAYGMTGFEGIAVNIRRNPCVGKTAFFMPGFCMLRFVHYGLCNKVYNTQEGLLVRMEDIHIANGSECE